MPVISRCPSCSAALKVADDALTKQVRCPKCKTVFRPQEMMQQAVAASPVPKPPPPPAPILVTPISEPEREEALEEFPQVRPARRGRTDDDPDVDDMRPRRRGRRSDDADDEEDEDLRQRVSRKPARLRGKGVGIAVMIVILLGLAAPILSIALSVYMVFLSRAIQPGMPQQVPNPVAVLMSIAGGGQLLLLPVSGILFLIWFSTAHANLRVLGVRGLQYSPGWAVGGFFVPFLNLVRPYQVMQEIWKASNPNVPSSERATLWSNRPGTGLIPAWWCCWLAAGILGNIAFRLGGPGLMPISSGLALLAAGVLLIFIIKGVISRQEEKWHRIQEEVAEDEFEG